MAHWGANVDEGPDSLTIHGVSVPQAGGVTVDSWGDHRIAMMAAVAATVCRGTRHPHRVPRASENPTPDFWEDYCRLGGSIQEVSS